MPVTLRRSCAACARAKHSCDLRTPRCSRCVRRNSPCHYANAPLTATATASGSGSGPAQAQALALTHRRRPAPVDSPGTASPPSSSTSSSPGVVLLDFGLGAACDPFESYPQIRLPRNVVQRLMDRFLSKIAFTYYPLDRSAASNPFITSWWPRALADPALFHVSLQTASLDEELMAQKGFPNSQVLMSDSISLLRRKVGDSSRAIQDETINAVVTLAAIEHGKGNVATSLAHIDGVKAMVELRGGINVVMQANSLTARMVTWVALLVTGEPQFPTQDDAQTQHLNDGLAPIEEWTALLSNRESSELDTPAEMASGLDPSVANVYYQVRALLQPTGTACLLPGSKIHDLTCFAIHRLLSVSAPVPQQAGDNDVSALTECLRYGLAIYMFLLHGHAYYPHAEILFSLVVRLHRSMELWTTHARPPPESPLAIWLLSTGMVAAAATPEWDWFAQQAAARQAGKPFSWTDTLRHLQSVLWHASDYYEQTYKTAWEQAL
ncbi:uncharacterized protein B0I36DRAFT_215117, partial [Microdochium trichocladiopsis]